MNSSRAPVKTTWPAGAEVWKANADKLRCVEVCDESENIRSYWFEGENHQHFRYLPGQHVILEFPGEPETQYRVFTLSSTPTRPERICVTVKTTRDSGITARMRNTVVPGVLLSALGIGGQFGILAQPVQKLLLIGAGSGMTPMISTLRWLYDRRETRPIVLLQQASTPKALIFHDEIHEIAKAMPNLRLVQVVSRIPEGESWGGYIGRFNRALLASLQLDLNGFDVFCCGPAGFMAQTQRALAASGFDMARYHDESFGVPEAEASEENALKNLAPTPDSPALTLSFEQKNIALRAGETLLSAMKRNGIRVTTGCKSGICGTCKVRLLSGRVTMNHRGGISAREEQAGLILACCSSATTDLQIAR